MLKSGSASLVSLAAALLTAFLLSPVPAEAASSRTAKSTAKKVQRVAPAKRTPVRSVVRKSRSQKSKVARVEPEFDREGNPLIRSSAFLVMDLNSGETILEKNSDAVVPIASITKLMTAMVALDAQPDLDETLEIGNDDVDRLKGTGSRLAVGSQLSRADMLRLALMASENRASSALSRHYPGGQSAFLAAMNNKARELGLSDTRFYDATGLNKDNVSSPRDLAKLVAAASQYPLIREFSTATNYTVSVNGRARHFHNTNSLVGNPDWQIAVSKTGYISESGKCLVMQAWMNGKPVAIVLMDSWGRFTRLGDANRIRKWFEAILPMRS